MTGQDGELDERDEAAIAAFMNRVATLDPSGAASRVPDPAALWWKAQLQRRWDAERRAQAPLDLMHGFEIAAGLATAATLLMWILP